MMCVWHCLAWLASNEGPAYVHRSGIVALFFMPKGMGDRKVKGRWRRQRRSFSQGRRREVAHRWETSVQTLIAQWSSPMHLMQRKSFIDWVINRWLLDRCQIYSCLRRWPRLTLEEWILCKTFRGVALLREIAAGGRKKIHWLPASVYGPFCGDVLWGLRQV